MSKLHEYLKILIREALLEAEDDDLEDDLPPDEGDEEDLDDEEGGEELPANSTGNPTNPNTNPQPKTPQVYYATADQMADLIRKTKGKIFTVEFIKRTDGTDRVMNARLGVKAYLHGGVLPYDPNEKNLIPCFDMQKKAYRMISIEGIKSLKVGQDIYVIPGTILKEVLLLKPFLREKHFRKRLSEGVGYYKGEDN